MDDKINGIMARLFKGILTDDEAMDEGLEKLFKKLSREDAEKVDEILSREGSLALYGFRNFDDFLTALGRGEQKAKDAMIEIIGTLKRLAAIIP
jgi:hypothetical protein